MGNAQSTRWKGHTKKTTVETCQRITAREAKHIGASTLSEQVAGTSARRLWCLCPDCEKRALYLYRLPNGSAWKCRKCHSLTNNATQQRGTRAAFAAWLTPDRWARMSQKHPATAELYAQTATDWSENVQPFDPAKISAIRRTELLEIYGSDEDIKRAFEDARFRWSERMETRGQVVGAEIRDDLWKWWKGRNRSR